MANTFTLDDIRAAADAKYAHTEITLPDGKSVRLLNALRLPKEKRDALKEVQGKLGEDDVDQTSVLEDLLRTVADGPVENLIKAVGGDLGVLMSIFESYTGGTQAGEASASED